MTNGIGRVGWRNYVSPVPTIWNNLTHYYSGDNTANDSKGTAHGTLVNGTTYGAAKIGSGFSLDGINDYVSLPSGTFNPSGSFTISSWFNITSLPTLKYIIKIGNFLDNSICVYVRSTATTFLVANASDYQVLDAPLPIFNTFNHVVCVKDTVSNKYLIYFNGVLAKQSTITINHSLPNLTTIIGAYNFPGIIDEVGLWDGKALTAAEVTELYNGGAGKQYVAITPTYTSRTTAFATATGITDTTILNALNTFDAGLISNGLDTKMKALYPFVGGTSNTHKYNFMDARDTNGAFRLQFNGGWTHTSTGATPNGTNAYANTYLTPSTNALTYNNNHLSFYSRTSNAVDIFDMGSMTDASANDVFSLWVRRTSNTAGYDSGNFATNRLTATNADAKGFYLNSANPSTSNIFKNGISLGSKTLTTSSISTVNTFIGAFNQGNSVIYYSNRECLFSTIGNGLTNLESTTFYTLVQALQTTLGRQV